MAGGKDAGRRPAVTNLALKQFDPVAKRFKSAIEQHEPHVPGKP